MNLAELVQGVNHVLLEATIASSTALVLVLLLRRRLRVMFGASVAYAGWLLVPMASIAVMLPAATLDTGVIPVVHGIVALPMQVVVASAEPGIRYAQWLCAAWLLGSVFAALHFMRQQRRFRATLGCLRARAGGLYQADAVAGLPAAIGWLKPLIVLPADFDTRYSVEQRGLMLAHEQSHVRHGDLQANAAYLVLRCLFWFNPLIHLVARVFRHDQELACDQRVIARHPRSRRAYGEAMFRTQLAAQPLPLGCHWGLTHPLKERIEMLKQPIPSAMRWLAGTSLVATLILATGVTAWAGQPVTSNQDGTSSPASTEAAASEPSVITAPDLPAPEYPKAAIAQGIEGKVLLVVDVSSDGSVMSARVEHSEPAGIFDAAALEAVKKWTFNPAMKNGKAIGGKVRVPITFESHVAEKPKDASQKPADNELDASAYDWVEYDLADNGSGEPEHCDVIKSNIAHAQTGYCGILKK